MSPVHQSPSPYNQQFPVQSPMRQAPMNIRPNGHAVNGYPPAQGPARSGTMGPPSLPTNKTTDINSLQDSLAGTGVNIDEEDRRLTSTDYYGHPTPNSPFSPQNSFGAYDDGRNGSMPYQNGDPQAQQLSQEEIQRRREAQENWEEARKVQHPLWKMFLYGENLNNKLKKHCADANLAPPQEGLYIAAKGHAPQVTRVNGLDDAQKVVTKGEPILKTLEGDGLADILKTICLGAQERLIGIVDLSARLALERKQHSAGKVPTEWQDIAVPSAPSPAAVDANGSPAAGASRKRMLLFTFTFRTLLTLHFQAPMRKPTKLGKCLDSIRSLTSSERLPSKSGKRKKLDLLNGPDGVPLQRQVEQGLLV